MELVNIKLSNVIKNQAILNIGCTGHVANGKSTIVKSFTGVTTQKFKSEKERNITINIGYSGCKIWYSKENNQIKYSHSKNNSILDKNGNNMTLIHHFSFVDCPGHEAYMNNMITGSAVMDMAFLVEDANMENLNVQSKEHLIALMHSEVSNVLIIQNKCDLINSDRIIYNKNCLLKQLSKYICNDRLHIIPCIAQQSVNLEYIIKYLINNLSNYDKNLNDKFKLSIIRTFDTNKQNEDIVNLRGGVLGGTIITGVLNKNDYIQISPGIIEKKDNIWKINPIITKVNTIVCEGNNLEYAIPGGLIGIGTDIDPYLCKMNKLIGQIVTFPGDQPDISDQITIKYKQFKKNKSNDIIKVDSVIYLSVLGHICDGKIIKIDNNLITICLSKPICLCENNISVLSNYNNRKSVLGFGKIMDYIKLENIFIPSKLVNINQKKKYTLDNDIKPLNKYDLNYDQMLENISKNKVIKKKLYLPKFEITKFKGNTLSLTNYNQIIESSKNIKDTIEFKTLFKNMFEKNIGFKSIIDNNQLLVNYKIKLEIFEKCIIKTINSLKKCVVCGSGNTFLTKVHRIVYINCDTCYSKNSVN